MKVIVMQNFYDLTAYTGRRAGDVIEVPEDRGNKLIRLKFAKAESAKPEKAETAKAKPVAKTAAKKVKKIDPTA